MRPVDPYEPFVSLAVATAAGFLIGLERERSRPSEESKLSFLGGARTHPLLALAGGVSTLAAREVGLVAVVVPFGALAMLLGLAYAGDVWRDRHRGITSEAAFLLSFLLGVLALTRGVLGSTTHKIFAVAAVAVVATFLLSAKPTLHPLVRRLSTEDVAATLKFLIVAVVVLPLLPDLPDVSRRLLGRLHRFDVLDPHPPQKLLPAVPEVPAGGGVDVYEPPLVVRNPEAVHRRLHDPPVLHLARHQGLLGPLAPGQVDLPGTEQGHEHEGHHSPYDQVLMVEVRNLRMQDLVDHGVEVAHHDDQRQVHEQPEDQLVFSAECGSGGPAAHGFPRWQGPGRGGFRRRGVHEVLECSVVRVPCGGSRRPGSSRRPRRTSAYFVPWRNSGADADSGCR